MTTNTHPSTQRLQQLNRMYRTISRCDHHMIRAESEQALAQNFCLVMVEEGSYRMAWVGYAESDEARSIRPVAYAGLESGYLENLNLTWADTALGSGPGARCIREQTVQVTRDIANDPRFAFWREEAVKRGYASSIALPLKIGAGTLGFLGMYSERRNAFDEEEIGLLTEAADDLAYGITARRVSRQLVLVQDAERRALAAELHDVVGQDLAAANAELGILKTRIGSAHAGAAEKVSVLLSRSVDAIRGVMVQLRPPGLDELGLAAALRWHAEAFEARSAIAVRVRAQSLPKPSPEVEDALLRIYLEALQNAAKHAGASHVEVELAAPAGRVVFSVADDGRGFEPSAPVPRNERSGWGLLIMRERAAVVGAELRIRSAAGKGTRVELVIPEDRWA